MPRRPLSIALACVWLLAVNSLQGQALSQAPPKQTKKAAPAKPKAAAPAPAPATAAPEPVAPPSDVRMVSTYTQGAQVFQSTTSIKGGRQRVEFPGMVTIRQCDLQRSIMLSPTAKRYRIQADAAAAPASQPVGPAASPASPNAGPGGQPRGGVVTITTSLTDTLERQQMLGLEARRVKTVITKQSDGAACDKTPMRTEIDAWYVDLPKAALSCSKASVQQEQPPAAGECHDRVESRVVGDVSLGFPVKSVTTNVTGESTRQETTTTSVEVTRLDITTLDAALFDIPSDYAVASSSMELMPAIAGGASLEEAMFGSTADGTSQAAPKKAGTIRIGVLEPVNKSTRTLNTRTLRQDLVGKFSKAPYEALPLSGSSAAAIQADASRLACDYILLGEITEVKASKPGKMSGFLKSAGGAPASASKDVYDVKANYRVYASDATTAPRAAGDVKASSGGGFSVGSALKMASFAGQMYTGVGMMRAMSGGGFGGLGMAVDPMSAIASTGGFGAMGRNYFDPRAMAMSSAMGSMSMGLGGRGPDPSDGEVYQTVSEAFDNLAKAATAKMTPRK
jgi:hypothetical protein